MVERRLRYDLKYMIGEGEHINQLRDSSHWKIGMLISQEPEVEGGRRGSCCSWRDLGGALRVDTAAIWNKLISGRTDNPGYDVIREWCLGKRSTIRTLQQALQSIGRADVITVIHDLRFGEWEYTYM